MSKSIRACLYQVEVWYHDRPRRRAASAPYGPRPWGSVHRFTFLKEALAFAPIRTYRRVRICRVCGIGPIILKKRTEIVRAWRDGKRTK